MSNGKFVDIFCSIFQTYRLFEFVASLLEHPYAKVLSCGYSLQTIFIKLETLSYFTFPFCQALLLKMGIMKILEQTLEQCDEAFILEEKLVSENRMAVKSSENILNFCMSSFKSLALIFDSRDTTPNACLYDE